MNLIQSNTHISSTRWGINICNEKYPLVLFTIPEAPLGVNTTDVIPVKDRETLVDS